MKHPTGTSTIGTRILSVLFFWVSCLNSKPHAAEALCNCGVAISKTYVRDDYNSGKTVLVRMGCNDEQMKTECLAAKREIEDFVASLMEFVDATYIRPSLDLINRMFVADKLTNQDYQTLREVIVRQRNAASSAVEDRHHPDCASGLWTETLYNTNITEPENTYNHWQRWNLNEIRDNALCASKHLEEELLKVQDEMKINRALRLDDQLAGPFGSKVNDLLREELDNDESKGLCPYTKRVLEGISRRQDVTREDIGGLGISTGDVFVRFLMYRAISEPPDVRLPASELSEAGLYEQGDLGEDSVCFPLGSRVIVAINTTTRASTSINESELNYRYTVKSLSDLQLGDLVVTGIGSKQHDDDEMIVTSPIVDFAHRMDDQESKFVSVVVTTKDASTKTITASPNHNIAFGVFNENIGMIEEYHKTFGMLQRYHDEGSNGSAGSVYVKSGSGKWMSVKRVFVSTARGFVAPITEQGVMSIVPEEELFGNDAVPALEKVQVYDLLSQSTRVSCFSSAPDTASYLISLTRRALWGPSLNEHGAGGGVIFDGIAGLFQGVGEWIGHLV